MLTKKQLIITAFENLDADMLEVLLNDGQAYQDVPKDIFIKELRRYFTKIKTYEGVDLNFKACKGHCGSCNKEKTGYSFINSENVSMMSLIFDETEDDYTDIYKCGSFSPIDKEIETEWSSISFYEEDKVNYLPTAKNFQDERLSTKAVKEIETEIENEGILSADFCVEWYQNYEKLQNWSEIFNGKTYRYKKEVKDHISKLSFVVSMMKAEKLAYKYWQEFINIPIISEESIKDWLIRCDHDLHNHIYGFPYESDFKHGYFLVDNIKFNLLDVYYIQNLSEVLLKYFDWIPYPNPITEKEDQNYSNDDFSDFPF